MYTQIDALIPKLVKADFEVDEKQRQVSLTEEGNEQIEQLLTEAGLLTEGSLYEAQNATLVHHVNQALRAHTPSSRATRTISSANREVVIIDEFTAA